jgi:AraC-like DNA-binding protein
VESVAESVGFKSSDAFRRAFERRVGVTPTAFRRHASSAASAKIVRPHHNASQPASTHLKHAAAA